jgi:allantoin racemase
VEILYLIPGDGMPEEEIRRREDVTNSIARQGTRVTVEEVGKGPLSIESAIEEYMAIAPMLERLYQLRKAKRFDAIIIGCAGDPGLRAARELMEVPVIGPAESSYYFACMIADRFSVISPLQAGVASADQVVARIREMGLASRLASVEFVDMPITEMWRDDSSTIIKQATRAIEHAENKGAGCAVLGCMSMAFRTANSVWDTVRIPVVNPLKVAVKTAEIFIDLGTQHSRVTYPAADLEKLVGTVFTEERGRSE